MAKQENSVLAVDIGGGCLKMAEFGTTESGAIVLQRFAVKELSDREMDPVLAFAVAYNGSKQIVCLRDFIFSKSIMVFNWLKYTSFAQNF